MLLTKKKTKDVVVRLAQSADEIEAAQRLRYEVFYEEFNAIPTPEQSKTRLDKDNYDDFADHLIVVNNSKDPDKEEIIGTYRLLQRKSADEYGQFYSSDEFDLTKLLESELTLLELSRSCVLLEYRTRPILQMLWQGIADYVTENDIDLLFGCASLHSTDVKSLSNVLSYMHHYHFAPEDIRVRAREERYIDMDLMPKDHVNHKQAFNELPPLLKGYLRVGATIGDGAVIDPVFNTTDVFVIMQTHLVTGRYRKHFERKIEKPFPGIDEIAKSDS